MSFVQKRPRIMNWGRIAVLEALALSLATLVCLIPAAAHAVTTWTDWTDAHTGGNASGWAGGIQVSYVGEVDGFTVNGTSGIWSPASSFTGGTVSVSPGVIRDHLSLNGDRAGTNTITFGSPVVNPLIAIWSLGANGNKATFTFDRTPTLEAGGPNTGFGGSPITVSGNVVSGIEGNGVVQFTGVFSSISWTNTYENYYAFTVGHSGPAPVPLPATLLLFGPALFGLIGLRRTSGQQLWGKMHRPSSIAE